MRCDAYATQEYRRVCRRCAEIRDTGGCVNSGSLPLVVEKDALLEDGGVDDVVHGWEGPRVASALRGSRGVTESAKNIDNTACIQKRWRKTHPNVSGLQWWEQNSSASSFLIGGPKGVGKRTQWACL